MGAGSKINIDVDLGIKGIEKTDIFVYLDGKLIETHYNKSYDDISTGSQRSEGQI